MTWLCKFLTFALVMVVAQPLARAETLAEPSESSGSAGGDAGPPEEKEQEEWDRSNCRVKSSLRRGDGLVSHKVPEDRKECLYLAAYMVLSLNINDEKRNTYGVTRFDRGEAHFREDESREHTQCSYRVRAGQRPSAQLLRHLQGSRTLDNQPFKSEVLRLVQIQCLTS